MMFPDDPPDLPAGTPALSRAPEPAALRTVRAVEFVRRMRGASQPCLLRSDDGEIYVVKFQNNPQHVRVLANEMLAARLAQLDRPARARPGFVEVPAELVAGNPDSGIPDWFPPRALRRRGCSSARVSPEIPARPWWWISSPTGFCERVRNARESSWGLSFSTSGRAIATGAR